MRLRFFSKNKVVHENTDEHELVECPICKREIKPYWEPRYNGIRATCDVCQTNWQES
jgi:hypothetical protein